MSKKLLIAFSLFLNLCLVSGQYTHEIHPNDRVMSIKMPTSEYNKWVNDQTTFSSSSQDVKNVTNYIYNEFKDDFDFIFFVLKEGTKPSNYSYFGSTAIIKNDIKGIGFNNDVTVDNTADFGSAGRLKAAIYLPALNYIQSGPALHQMAAYYLNWGITVEIVNGINPLSTISTRGFWGWTGGNVKGQRGGFQQSTLVENQDGSFTVDSFGETANNGNSTMYTQLELYLMGMGPVTDIDQFDIFTDLTEVNYDQGTQKFTFKANTRRTFTSANIQNEYNGARVPDHNAAQHDFNALVVVLTDTDLTQAEWDTVDATADWFSHQGADSSGLFNFHEATNGVGSITFTGVQSSALNVNSVNLDDSHIQVYPNPANDYLTVNTNGNLKSQVSVRLNNIVGQKVLDQKYEQVDNAFVLNVEHLPTGIYILDVSDTSSNRYIRKIEIQ